MTKILVIGAAGTVGMGLVQRLRDLGLEVLEASARYPETYRDAAFECKVAALCLADCARDVIVATVAELERMNPEIRIIDASATFREDPDWVYGLPEITSRNLLYGARRVANPGCFASGCILLSYPLPHLDWVFFGQAGHTAAGRLGALRKDLPAATHLAKEHRHQAEIARHARCRAPILVPSLGPWAQGMLVQAFLPMQDVEELRAVYCRAYRHSEDVEVLPGSVDALSPLPTIGTTKVLLAVTQRGHGVLVTAAYDNLGKGAAGAAVRNIQLMLGDSE